MEAEEVHTLVEELEEREDCPSEESSDIREKEIRDSLLQVAVEGEHLKAAPH